MDINIMTIKQNLKHDDFVTAQGIRNDCMDAGLSIGLAYAIAFGAGLSEGRKRHRTEASKAWQEVNRLRDEVIRLQNIIDTSTPDGNAAAEENNHE